MIIIKYVHHVIILAGHVMEDLKTNVLKIYHVLKDVISIMIVVYLMKEHTQNQMNQKLNLVITPVKIVLVLKVLSVHNVGNNTEIQIKIIIGYYQKITNVYVMQKQDIT